MTSHTTLREELIKDFGDFCNTDNFSAPPDEIETIVDYWLKVLSSSATKIREEALREVIRINLAPDTEDIKNLNGLSEVFSGLGYGQVWVLKKVEALLPSEGDTNPTSHE